MKSFGFARWAVLLAFLSLPSLGWDSVVAAPLQFEIYATSHQVAQYCADEEGCRRIVERLKELGAAKIYLEVYRGGHRVPGEVLTKARDQIVKAGLEVAGGITTTPGEGFGVASNGNPAFFNYEAKETRDRLKELFEFAATNFDEIMIDDFFLTDDGSTVSDVNRSGRTWSDYRLDLMTEVAECCVAAPARKVNPKVSMTLKYPQWYDRFREYGYNVESGPRIFDQIWVGTETRNPDTPRFGYCQPTMGCNNYRWLSSLGGRKVEGAWFDAYDCTEDIYLMQAYQSVLAGARNLTLFNLEEVLGPNPILGKFIQRKETLVQLAGILADRRPLGIAAYKPPRARSGHDMYLPDFLSVLGLPIVPVGRAEDCDAYSSILLSGEPTDGANLSASLNRRLHEQGKTLVYTPSFLRQGWGLETFQTKTLLVEGVPVEATTDLSFQKFIDPRTERFRLDATEPRFGETLISAVAGEETIPVLARSVRGSAAGEIFLNVFTYSFQDFDKVAEMFLPPTRLAIPDWPEEFANAIRKELPLGLPVRVEAKPPFGLNLYEGGFVVISNFEGETKEVRIETETESSKVSLHPGFTHAVGIDLQQETNQQRRLKIPPWEIAVLNLSSSSNQLDGKF